jgi:hypothetical protein
MHRFLRRAFVLPLLALALSLLACDPSWLTVEIPDYSSNQIEGVWVWRWSQQATQFERDTLIHFRGVHNLSSGPLLAYSTYSSQGDLSLTAAIVRSPTNPNAITVTLGFERGASGLFKVSTYNAVGESALSAQTARLF